MHACVHRNNNAGQNWSKRYRCFSAVKLLVFGIEVSSLSQLHAD